VAFIYAKNTSTQGKVCTDVVGKFIISSSQLSTLWRNN